MREAPSRSRPAFEEAYAWIRANTGAGDAFASVLYARDAFYSGRPFVPMTDLLAGGAPLGEAMRRRRVGFVLWTGEPDLGSSWGPRFFWARALARARLELDGPGFRKVASGPGGAAVFALAEGARGTKITSSKP
jgi:hypothetical protein